MGKGNHPFWGTVLNAGASYAAAVRRLVANGAQRQLLCRQARQMAEERFGQEAVLRKLEQEVGAVVGLKG